MQSDTFFEQLNNPKTFDLDASIDLTVLQTHISYVVLAGDSAYKIKKPVDFGFLDFSTLDKRKKFCHQEVLLNKRLCPQLYEEVVSLTSSDDETLQVNGSGEIIDYAVKMHRFSQDQLMNKLLQKQLVHKYHIEQINDILVNFYTNQQSSQDINEFGSLLSIKKNVDENFDQTKDVIGATISLDRYQFIKKTNNLFFKRCSDVFEKRIEAGVICDCHGDLHSGNIVIDDDICIFDCIEFNKRFRYIDVASDIGFLAMDLDMMNHPFLSSYLIKDYVEKSNDTGIFQVLNFYKSYRAYVRGKVTGFQLEDNQISNKKKDELVSSAKHFFELSAYYAGLLYLQMHVKKPILFLVSGMTGTGKSTLASKIAVDYDATALNTDVIRKNMAGIDQYERHHDELDSGLYAPDRVKSTYDRLLKKAEIMLSEGRSVILDATFQKQKRRKQAATIAENNQAIFVPIECRVPESIAKKWLEQRLKQKTVSDGRWEIYQQQKNTFEPFTEKIDHIIVDMSKEKYEERMNEFQQILDWINERV